MASSSGTKTAFQGLYIVSTPIGNLSDISLRAIDVLRKCELVLCEDTRVSRKLLNAHNINTPLKAYHDHNGEKLRPKIIKELESGKSIALISDAGTPLISDPGYKLVKETREQDIPVTPIPGASAFLAGLSVSGLPTDKFIFLGFLPPKETAAKNLLLEYLSLKATQIYYEAVPRIGKTLRVLESLCPDREIVVARELTKAYEEVLAGTPGEISKLIERRGTALKGEIVLLISPAGELADLDDAALSRILTKALQTQSVSHAAKEISQKYKLPRKRVYELALKLSEN